jgi:hypothetical protein
MKCRLTSFALVALLLPACAMRSISNPGRPYGSANTSYAGELSDFAVVGSGGAATDGDGGTANVTLRPRQRLLVMQSGAAFPDDAMVTGLAQHFEVGTASGIPSDAFGEHGLRTAAARGGFDAVVAYWGVLESRPRPTAGKAASWFPIAGFFVPDESQQMRIRLRIVVLDVASGRWRSLMPTPIDDERASSLVTRHSRDMEQVEHLKEAAYVAAVEAIAALAQK